MYRKMVLWAGVMIFTLSACSLASTLTSAFTATQPATPPARSSRASAAKSSSPKWPTKSNDGGSVTVDVTPTAVEVGQPIAFAIAMNTHSVDLSDDLTKIAILRDDAGKEYKPIAWDGPGGGGHHRSGVLQFAALSFKPRYFELVIQGLAQVPERVFHWNLE
jgi:hypothetical protein